MVETISPQTVQRILSSYRLRPWRVHHWLSGKRPIDDEFRRRVEDLCDLYTRPLGPDERVFCVDEKTSLQARPRTAPNLPSQPGGTPVRVEHEYRRVGALQLIAAFDIGSGSVTAICRPRKRQQEFIELLETIDGNTPKSVTAIHLVCDNLKMHSGKLVQAWLENHGRFTVHFTPVHCSWMNQVEQWFSILQRKRLSAPNFSSIQELENRINAFIDEWNAVAHPFRWSKASFTKVFDRIEAFLHAA